MKSPKIAILLWCSGRDLNPHAFRHTPLKRTCLPFHHPSVREGANFPQTATAGKCRVYSALLVTFGVGIGIEIAPTKVKVSEHDHEYN